MCIIAFCLFIFRNVTHSLFQYLNPAVYLSLLISFFSWPFLVIDPNGVNITIMKFMVDEDFPHHSSSSSMTEVLLRLLIDT